MHELSDGLVLRTARADDLDGILALLNDDAIEGERVALAGATAQRYAASFAAVTADPRHELVVVTAPGENRVLATAHLVVIPGLSWQGLPRAQLQGFRVAAELRGQGIGERVLRWLIARARQHGCGFVQVVTDKRRHDAHRFYSRHGFRPTHEGLKLWLGGE